MKILFAASEAHPLIKTGGLADVAGSLPVALAGLRQDIRLVLPAYADVLKHTSSAQLAATFTLTTGEQVDVLQTTLPNSGVTLYLLAIGNLFARSGNPYNDSKGLAWPDSAERFTGFCRALCELSCNRAGLDWKPDVFHGNDWQTGLVPALLTQEQARPRTLFTVHNLAYGGNFDLATYMQLGLPIELFTQEALEFYGGFSCIKGGLACADHINTVSPTYAREICTPGFGHGFEGLLRHRSHALSGILNGIDVNQWNPASDPHIAKPFDRSDISGKAICKAALQSELGLPEELNTPLLGHIGRLVDQKGVDLILEALPALLAQKLQLVILGSGDPALEQALRDAAKSHGQQLAIRIGYDEALAHRIEAGCDMFLMPSRFEPCGLNQLYSLRYGTIPVVRRTGGLADSVIDAHDHTLRTGVATGLVFDEPSAWGLQEAVARALTLFADRKRWHKLVATAMKQPFSWRNSAQAYLALYRRLMESQS